jgi:PAS domain S-box-containing protein
MKKKRELKILMLEDDPNDAELIINELKILVEYNSQISWVTTKNEFLNALNQFIPDIILSDFNLPQYSGLEALSDLKQIQPLIPFIFVTGAIDEETAVETIKAGAWDYVVKDRLVRLPLAVRNALQLYKEKINTTKAKEALRYSETRWQFALEGAGHGVWDWNYQSGQVYFSKQWKAILGFHEFDLKNHIIEWEKRIHQEDFPEWTSALSFYFNNRTSIFQNEHRLLCKNNTYKWVLSRGKTIEMTSDGKPIRIIGTLTDITDRKNAEFQLIKNELRLKMQNEELRLAKERAEESDRLKTSFLQNVSHEIRTPMNGIIGFVDLLQDRSLSENKRTEFVEIVNVCCNQLLAIVNDILEISKIEIGSISLQITTFSLKKLLDDIYNLYYFQAKDKHINFSVSTTCENLSISSDFTKLQQILSNLISNAIKFTDKGSVSVSCIEGNQHLLFAIRDTGIGIPEDQKEKIFERFHKIDSEKDRLYSGTGLGLSIAKGLVDLMEGKIWLESTYGQGSVFYLSIPHTNGDMFQNRIRDEIEVKPKTNNLRILLAEDDVNNVRYISELLYAEDLEIINAKNGMEAIGILNNEDHIDLILMDIKMPVMDGFEATSIIKSKWPQIPVIALTAYAMSEDIQKATTIGFDGYLTKPVRRGELLSKINQFTVNSQNRSY